MLEVENTEDILKLKTFYDVPIWFYMRNHFYEGLSKVLNNDTPTMIARKTGIDTIKCLIKSLLYNITHRPKGNVDIVFYTISREVKKEGKYFNQYTDDYAQLFKERGLSIQHPALDWSWRFPRYNNNVQFSCVNLAISSFLAKFQKRDYEKVNELYEFAACRAKKIYGVELSIEEKNLIISNTIYDLVRMHKHAKWLYKKCIKYKTKMVIMLGGSYSWYYEMNHLLKQSGVKTVDLQHGIISSTNVVYNYAPNLLENYYVKEAAPSYYFTYGEWWSTQSNIPYEAKISIGNIYREQTMKNIIIKRHNRIVFIGCNRKTAEYLKLAQSVKLQSKETEVIFRPHPTERYETQLLMDKYKYSIKVDYGSDLYELLASTNVLVSEISTVLFEAIGIVDKIYVWNTLLSKSLSPQSPFIKFETVDELLELIAGQTGIEMPVNINEIWKENAMKNFKEICKKEGIL